MNEARQAIINSFSNPDPTSFGVFKMVNDVYPAFAKKIFQNNFFMEKLVMSGYNPMHILDYPICGKCETLAVYDGYAMKNGKRVNACSCFAEGCGRRTIDPITFKQWLVEEMRRKVPAGWVDNVDYVVDRMAQAMVNRYFRDCRAVFERQKLETLQKLGIVDSVGNPIESDVHHEVTLTESSVPVDLEEEGNKIGREENADVRRIED